MVKLAVLPGDGIGPEIMEQALRVLEVVGKKYDFTYTVETGLLGGAAIDATGEPFPQETRELVLKSDAVLLGAVGGPQWDQLPGEKRPEKGLLGIRKALNLYANLRPVKCWPQLMQQSPLKNEKLAGVMGNPIAYWAHIGGFVAGIFLMLVMGKKTKPYYYP